MNAVVEPRWSLHATKNARQAEASRSLLNVFVDFDSDRFKRNSYRGIAEYSLYRHNLLGFSQHVTLLLITAARPHFEHCKQEQRLNIFLINSGH